MVDLVNLPNARYNQGLQGLSMIIGGSVSTEYTSAVSAAFSWPLLASPCLSWLFLASPGFPWASLGLAGLPCSLGSLGPFGFPWASLDLPGPPWASLGLPGRPWVPPTWASLSVPGPPWVPCFVLFEGQIVFVLGSAALGLLGPPWVSLGLLGFPGSPGVVAEAVQIPRMCGVLTL